MVGSAPDAWSRVSCSPRAASRSHQHTTAHDAAEACALSEDSTHEACLSDGFIWIGAIAGRGAAVLELLTGCMTKLKPFRVICSTRLSTKHDSEDRETEWEGPGTDPGRWLLTQLQARQPEKEADCRPLRGRASLEQGRVMFENSRKLDYSLP